MGRTHLRNIKVAVHAPDPFVAAGLLAMLGPTPGIELVADHEKAEVTVADSDTLLGSLTTTSLVLIADELRQAELYIAIEHGLIVLVPRSEATTSARLLRAITDAHEGRGDIPAEQLVAVLQKLRHLHEQTPTSGPLTLSCLSPRDTAIIRMLAEGMDTREIAEKLVYSERTVKNVLHTMLSRLNLRNRAHLVSYALRHNLV